MSAPGEVPGPGGVCFWGVPDPGGSTSGGCLLWGVSAPRGMSAPGGVCSGGVVSQHALKQTPPEQND